MGREGTAATLYNRNSAERLAVKKLLAALCARGKQQQRQQQQQQQLHVLRRRIDTANLQAISKEVRNPHREPPAVSLSLSVPPGVYSSSNGSSCRDSLGVCVNSAAEPRGGPEEEETRGDTGEGDAARPVIRLQGGEYQATRRQVPIADGRSSNGAERQSDTDRDRQTATESEKQRQSMKDRKRSPMVNGRGRGCNRGILRNRQGQTDRGMPEETKRDGVRQAVTETEKILSGDDKQRMPE